ncbi:glycosyltransferase family 4 protein [Calycomorphotria hydatis]|uniref:GDP-mannose-dependent alpha-(1-6)-phosphatidylinositol monomannoside mannosyltransferase n=1 Tax=Calycomorphotria hydatis TaxID=2528027 RepID=A0A517T3D9_9PLAN|nr:glycosyltransferase family 4 protein [Calycomorphotria hydatis]QDT62893.1 GDP-mannose-dependent alpha-(1-6)-phosphatidylinositol monomannoside mannosyltransferase [Calycomorphotria hydatis]
MTELPENLVTEDGECPRLPRKTLLLTEIFPPRVGGSGNWLWEMYRRLDPTSVVVVAGETEGADEFDREAPLSIQRFPLTLQDTGGFSPGGFGNYWSLARRLARLCREEQIEEIHCARVLPEGWVAWWVKQFTGIPFRCFAHGEEVNLPRGSEKGVMSSRQHRLMAKLVLGATHGMIANSVNTAGILKLDWGLPSSKVFVVHPGVDTEFFTPAERDPVIRDQLGWSLRPVILTVGRLQRRKGHDKLIEALPQIRERLPDVLYAIVGDGEERERLQQLVEQHGVTGNVKFHGALRDKKLLHCYQQCDLFVLPNRAVGSDIEGFGMVLLEAQACGKAVIAGDSGGTREALSLDETGLLTDASRSTTLAEVVLKLLTDKKSRQQLETAARPWVESRFSWDAVVNRFVAVVGGETKSGIMNSV